MLFRVYPQITRQIINKIIFTTKKSRQQNTPRLFKNPKLTPYGLLKKQPKSYAYQLPENLPNRQLYWNNKQQNAIARLSMRISRLQKLKISPIHTIDGIRTYTRTLPQILWELADLNLLKESLGRTLENLREVLRRFPVECNEDEKPIINYAIRQIHQRNLPSMNFYEFSTFCQIRYMAKLESTDKLMIYFYGQMQKAYREKKDKLKFKLFVKTANYIFSRQYSDEYKELLFTQKVQFKLFEDNPPQIKSLENILPKIYSNQQLQNLAKLPQTSQMMNLLNKVPGGVQLAAKIKI